MLSGQRPGEIRIKVQGHSPQLRTEPRSSGSHVAMRPDRRMRPFRHSQPSLQFSYPLLQFSYPLLQLGVLGVLLLNFVFAGRVRVILRGRPSRLESPTARLIPIPRRSRSKSPLGVGVHEVRVAELRHGVFVALAGRVGHGYQYGLVRARSISVMPITRQTKLIHHRRALRACLGTLSSNAWTRVAASAASVWALDFCR